MSLKKYQILLHVILYVTEIVNITQNQIKVGITVLENYNIKLNQNKPIKHIHILFLNNVQQINILTIKNNKKFKNEILKLTAKIL